MRENRISVDKAPKGMSRQKANQTRWLPKAKRIMWTVEWIDVEGEKRLCEVYEGATIAEAYAAMLAERAKESRKRKRPSGETSIPVKTSARLDHRSNCSPIEATDGINVTESHSKVELETNAADALASDLSAVPNKHDTDAFPDTGSRSPQKDHEATNTTEAQLSTAESEEPQQHSLPGTKSANPPSTAHPHFYLHKVHTTSSSRVLRPINSSDVLTSVLRDQVVLEFPTIHVLNEPPDQLPTAFTTETEYLKAKREEELELEGIMGAAAATASSDSRLVKLEGGLFGSVGGGGTGRDKDGDGNEEDWDERQILEMLKRDVKA